MSEHSVITPLSPEELDSISSDLPPFTMSDISDGRFVVGSIINDDWLEQQYSGQMLWHDLYPYDDPNNIEYWTHPELRNKSHRLTSGPFSSGDYITFNFEDIQPVGVSYDSR